MLRGKYTKESFTGNRKRLEWGMMKERSVSIALWNSIIFITSDIWTIKPEIQTVEINYLLGACNVIRMGGKTNLSLAAFVREY